MVGYMSYVAGGAGATAVPVHRYKGSKLWFRGTQRDSVSDEIVVLGGSEGFGRFVKEPFPKILEDRLQRRVENFAVQSAGIDTFLQDPVSIKRARNAPICIVQAFPADMLSNRYYRVHPRRNDRLVEPTKVLKALFPEVDFTAFHFTGHMLNELSGVSRVRFENVVRELNRALLAKYKLLFHALGSSLILLLCVRYSQHKPTGNCTEQPYFVSNKTMLALEKLAWKSMDVDVRCASDAADLSAMNVGTMQLPIARQSLGPSAHRRIARHLETALNSI